MGRSKHIAAALIALCLSILSVFSCFGATEATDIDEEAAQDVLLTGMSWMSFVNNLSDDDLQYLVDNSTAEDLQSYFPGFKNMAGGLQSVLSNRKDIGAYKGIKDSQITEDESNYYAELTLEYEDRDVNVVVGLDRERTQYTRFSFDPVYTFAEKMSNAAMNLLVGMVTVFAVLILLMFIIDSFKYIHAFEEKHRKKSAPAAAVEQTQAVPAAVTPAPAGDSAMNDAQLAAVITAAIAAYEGTSADGLIVRSIKRAKDNKWRRS